MESVASLTRTEAEERAALIEVNRYDIEVDLRGLFEGVVLEATSTITFTCREPGASTFVDCVADVSSATLNGVALDPATAERGRLPLPDLRAENVLVVASSQSDTASAHGIQRTVDPSDKLVYLWTSFECDFARMAWANFDQPDLKAVHGFVVSAPETWTVLSNSASTSVEELATAVASGRSRTRRRCRRTSWWSMPARSTSCGRGVVVTTSGCTAGSRWRSCSTATPRSCSSSPSRGSRGSASSSVCRSARSATTTCSCPTSAARWRTAGCVTCGDWALPRSTPTYDERREIAEVVLHEMAHMWFGDLVTMRWWDDLWLNEAFASWAACWAAEGATGSPTGGPASSPSRSWTATASTWGRRPTRSAARSPMSRRRWRTSTPSPTQGRRRAQAARRVRRRGRLPRRPARLLPRARVGQHHAGRPHRCDRLGQRARPRRVGDRPGSTAQAPTRSCSPATP